jgi:hypothetical protein
MGGGDRIAATVTVNNIVVALPLMDENTFIGSIQAYVANLKLNIRTFQTVVTQREDHDVAAIHHNVKDAFRVELVRLQEAARAVEQPAIVVALDVAAL